MQAQAPLDFNFVLFGATGDLAVRKIFPALFEAYTHKLLHPKGQIIALGRSDYGIKGFLEHLDLNSKPHIQNYDEKSWLDFVKNIKYLSLDINNAKDFTQIKKELKSTVNNTIIYFSVSAEFFIPACKNLALIKLNDKDTRIVLEKPLGRDLKEAFAINEAISEYFKEEQIYRIDHYLGKASVQNILKLRFSNTLFESLWNKDYIQNIQISVFETLGVGTRGEFYDSMGALRDMLQNHMLQILSLLCMQKPSDLDSESIRKEKQALLECLRLKEPIKDSIFRAQYVANKGQKGYLQEEKIKANSSTESFVALRFELDNERYQGVPFYLRTGKRMAKNLVQIAIIFKEKHSQCFEFVPKSIILNLQPQNTIQINIELKTQEGMKKQSIEFDLSSKELSAYTKLLLAAIHSQAQDFNSFAELEAAWKAVMPALEAFEANVVPMHEYPSASLPKEADVLVVQDGNTWYEAE